MPTFTPRPIRRVDNIQRILSIHAISIEYDKKNQIVRQLVLDRPVDKPEKLVDSTDDRTVDSYEANGFDLVAPFASLMQAH